MFTLVARGRSSMGTNVNTSFSKDLDLALSTQCLTATLICSGIRCEHMYSQISTDFRLGVLFSFKFRLRRYNAVFLHSFSTEIISRSSDTSPVKKKILSRRMFSFVALLHWSSVGYLFQLSETFGSTSSTHAQIIKGDLQLWPNSWIK